MDKVQISKFDGTDFPVWQAQMEALLIAKDCGQFLLEKKEKPLIVKAKVLEPKEINELK